MVFEVKYLLCFVKWRRRPVGPTGPFQVLFILLHGIGLLMSHVQCENIALRAIQANRTMCACIGWMVQKPK